MVVKNNLKGLKEPYLLLFISSFGGSILNLVSFKTLLFAIFFSKDKRREGNNNKLDTIANSKVTETKPPKAIVPPKLESVKTKKPKNNTIDV